MTGAELLLRKAELAGTEVCFANAGTTEIPLVQAFDRLSTLRPILCLFEGVCSGAADGYARIKGAPGLTLLHLGPGTANAVANFHNARKARTPIINLVGEHMTRHEAGNAPLTMDIEALAATFSGWYRTCGDVDSLNADMDAAVRAARLGQIATLILPQDVQAAAVGDAAISLPSLSFVPVDVGRVAAAADLLRRQAKTALFLDGRALSRRGMLAAARIREVLGCTLLTPSFPVCVERGAGWPELSKLPYFPEDAFAVVEPFDAVVLADARDPVTFFGYEGLRSHVFDHRQIRLALNTPHQDGAEALEALADYLQAPPASGLAHTMVRLDLPALPSGPLTPEAACRVIAALQPEGAIVMDEGLTSSVPYFRISAAARPHTYLTLTGGAIGQGMPAATGAALAAPERPVLNIQADGSAMYTVQSLWTQAREGLNVTTLLCSNRSYHIIRTELKRAGMAAPGRPARSLLELDAPALDWVSLSRGMGVPAVAVDTAEALAREMGRALAEPGPHLIEMRLPPS